MAIAGAWLIAVVAQSTGNAALLHHHALIEGGPPIWIAVPLFLVTWQVMIAAMMLPASLPSIGLFNAGVALMARPRRALAAFLGSCALVWTAFGLLAFTGDVLLHHVVDATPWLATRRGSSKRASWRWPVPTSSHRSTGAAWRRAATRRSRR